MCLPDTRRLLRKATRLATESACGFARYFTVLCSGQFGDSFPTLKARTYLISCIRGTGARFAQGFAAGAGAATVSGCMVPPGTYKARWDKDRLKVLHEKNGKSKETTFAVLSSADVSAEKAQRSEKASAVDKTVIKVSSTPGGADIELDGSFVGQTPSSVLVLPGDHSIRITKTGYKQWERKIKTSGGEVTMFAELESQH